MRCASDLHCEKIFIIWREKRVKSGDLCLPDEKLLRYGVEEKLCKNSEKKIVYFSEPLYSILDC